MEYKSAGWDVIVGKVPTFDKVATDKAQALKPLEEAAEVFGAWQAWNEHPSPEGLTKIYDECADTVQAICNLLAAFGRENFVVDMEACAYRNHKRGRM